MGIVDGESGKAFDDIGRGKTRGGDRKGHVSGRSRLDKLAVSPERSICTLYLARPTDSISLLYNPSENRLESPLVRPNALFHPHQAL